MKISKEVYQRLANLVESSWVDEFVEGSAGETLQIRSHYNHKGICKEKPATIETLSELHDVLTEAATAVQSIMYMVQRGEIKLGEAVEVDQ